MLHQCLKNNAKETMAVFLASYETDQNFADRQGMEDAFEEWKEEFIESDAVWYDLAENELTAADQEDLNEATDYYQEHYYQATNSTPSVAELLRRYKVVECDPAGQNWFDLRDEFSVLWQDKFGDFDEDDV